VVNIIKVRQKRIKETVQISSLGKPGEKEMF